MAGVKRRKRDWAPPSRPSQVEENFNRADYVDSEQEISESEEDNYAEEGSEDDFVEEGSGDEEGSVEDMEDSDTGEGEVQKEDEMKELEEEYKKLKDEEQNILRNLKGRKDEDLRKGQAVKNQRAIWDKTLEVRFLLQKPFSGSNRLPQEPARSLFCKADREVNEAYSDLIASSKNTLEAILELQQALVKNNPQIAPSEDADAVGVTKKVSASDHLDGDLDEEWLHISEMQSRTLPFRNKSIDRWQRKALVATGAAAIKNKLHAFNQSISEQVHSYMRDPSKMVKGMQQNGSAVSVFGNVPNSNENSLPEGSLANGNPELLDDSEIYQQLLKEFFETVDPSSSETAFYALKRLQTKKRKVVDRRASKSRKIRYNVHEKLVNFMAPRPMNLPPLASKLFASLFSGKTV